MVRALKLNLSTTNQPKCIVKILHFQSYEITYIKDNQILTLFLSIILEPFLVLINDYNFTIYLKRDLIKTLIEHLT